MKITVTQEHIDGGVKDSPWACPIARALPRAPAGYDYEVFEDRVHLWSSREGARYSYLPEEARLFVAKFDNGEAVEPFEFELDLPEAP